LLLFVRQVAASLTKSIWGIFVKLFVSLINFHGKDLQHEQTTLVKEMFVCEEDRILTLKIGTSIKAIEPNNTDGRISN